MYKIAILILLSVSALFPNQSDYFILNKHSFTLPKNTLEIKSSYLKVNDTIDVLNVKEQELGALNRFGSMGDMDGYEIELRYGVTSYNIIFFNYQRWNIDYAGSTLKNNTIELFNRYRLINQNSFLDSLSLDIGFTHNYSKPINIKNDELLNSMIKKIRPNTSIVLDKGDIISGDTTLAFYDNEWNKIYPYLSISNLKSKSYYVRALIAKQLTANTLIDVYIAAKYTDIRTGILLEPKENSYLNKFIGEFKIPNLNRTEKSINIGFVTTLYVKKFTMEFNYEYNKIYRDKELRYMNHSHIIEASISKKIYNNFLLYIGGRLMLQQFNTDLPYLYNKYTQTQFDKKYGFAKIGLVYSFKGL